MPYFILFLACVFTAGKVLLQSKFAKTGAGGLENAMLFNSIVFLAAALTSSASLFSGEINTEIIPAAVIFGICNMSFQVFYVLALACGPTSLTALLSCIGMVIPTFVSVFLYGEMPSITGWIGFALVIVMLLLNKKSGNGGQSASARWAVLALIMHLSNAGGIMTQKVCTKTFEDFNSAQFVAIAYFLASVLAFVLFVFLRARNKEGKAPFSGSTVLYALGVGLLLCGFQVFYTDSIKALSSAVVMPVQCGLSSVMITLGSVLFFKERLAKKQIAAVLVGIIAVVLISL